MKSTYFSLVFLSFLLISQSLVCVKPKYESDLGTPLIEMKSVLASTPTASDKFLHDDSPPGHLDFSRSDSPNITNSSCGRFCAWIKNLFHKSPKMANEKLKPRSIQFDQGDSKLERFKSQIAPMAFDLGISLTANSLVNIFEPEELIAVFTKEAAGESLERNTRCLGCCSFSYINNSSARRITRATILFILKSGFTIAAGVGLAHVDHYMFQNFGYTTGLAAASQLALVKYLNTYIEEVKGTEEKKKEEIKKMIRETLQEEIANQVTAAKEDLKQQGITATDAEIRKAMLATFFKIMRKEVSVDMAMGAAAGAAMESAAGATQAPVIPVPSVAGTSRDAAAATLRMPAGPGMLAVADATGAESY